jgi:hypothetical protein
MAWNQKPIMEQKQQFVSLAATGRFTFTPLGRQHLMYEPKSGLVQSH